LLSFRGYYALAQWLLEEDGASMSKTHAADEMDVWVALLKGITKMLT
jgi:hypothetical protein